LKDPSQDPEGKGNNDGLSPLAKQSRAATPWLNAVWQFTGSVFFLVGVGYAVDKYGGTGPWGLVVGGLVGSGVGFYAFIRAANRLMDQDKKK
jgi:F0F1-type ATP synthase assembly protein I